MNIAGDLTEIKRKHINRLHNNYFRNGTRKYSQWICQKWFAYAMSHCTMVRLLSIIYWSSCKAQKFDRTRFAGVFWSNNYNRTWKNFLISYYLPICVVFAQFRNAGAEWLSSATIISRWTESYIGRCCCFLFHVRHYGLT